MARHRLIVSAVSLIKERLVVTKVKPTKLYVSSDIKVNMTYEFNDGNRNAYRVIAINESGEAVVQRLKSNAAGPAGEFIFSSTPKICEHLNSGAAKFTGTCL